MKMTTAKGRLTRYALACGYIESFQNGEFNARLRIPSPSSGVIMVTAQNDDWRVLYSGRNLTKARAAFDDYKKSVS
jgi:hypothetical protein